LGKSLELKASVCVVLPAMTKVKTIQRVARNIMPRVFFDRSQGDLSEREVLNVDPSALIK
jgi:hypothetical protein